MTHKMLILNSSGHDTVTWEIDQEVQVEEAQAQFEKMVQEGYSALAMENVGTEEEIGTPIETFDPEADTIMMLFPMVGG